MSEERFDRIEGRLDDLSRVVGVLQANVTTLKADVADLRVDATDLKVGQSDLRRHMGVLHEEVLERISVLAFNSEPLRREFQAADAELRETLIGRIEPLEAAARRKSRRR